MTKPFDPTKTVMYWSRTLTLTLNRYLEGQMPLDDNRRRVQCRQANQVYGKPRKGRSAKGVLGYGQPESPSLQAGEGMAGEERGANRGVLSPELQSGAEPGRKAECRLETRYHHERSETNEGWFAGKQPTT